MVPRLWRSRALTLSPTAAWRAVCSAAASWRARCAPSKPCLLGGDPGRPPGDPELFLKIGERPVAGEVVDAIDVGVDAVGEVLGPGRRHPLDEVLVDVDVFVGVDAGVVAVEVGVELGGEAGEVGVGDEQPVLGHAP